MTEHSTLAQLREAAAFFQQPPPPKATPPEVPIDTLLTAAADEIERLRAALKQALSQWSMYADMVERESDFDLEKEQSLEGDKYRRLLALANGSACEQPAREEGK